MLADDKDLVTALAHHLADPKSAVLREDFLDGARAAIDVDDLSDYLAGFSEPVTLRGHDGRITTTGPAVSTIGDGNRTTVTPEVRTRRARERGIQSTEDLMPPTPAKVSFNDSTYTLGLSGEDNPPPSSEIEERRMREPEIKGPSMGGPGGF